MQAQPAKFTDLDRAQIALTRLYFAAIDAATRAEAAEQEELNGETDQLASDGSVSEGATRNDIGTSQHPT